MHVCMHVYVYIYRYICICVYIYISLSLYLDERVDGSACVVLVVGLVVVAERQALGMGLVHKFDPKALIKP